MKKSTLIPSLVLTASLFISGCTACQSTEEIQRSNFIKASKQLGCEIINNPKLAIETSESKNRVKEIFTENSLPINDDAAMTALFDKYAEDQSVQTEVKDFLNNECKVEAPTTPATPAPTTEATTPKTPTK